MFVLVGSLVRLASLYTPPQGPRLTEELCLAPFVYRHFFGELGCAALSSASANKLLSARAQQYSSSAGLLLLSCRVRYCYSLATYRVRYSVSAAFPPAAVLLLSLAEVLLLCCCILFSWVSKIFDWLSVHLRIVSKMQNSRRQQNYSDESNPSSNSQSSIRSAATGTTQEVTSPPDSVLYTKANNRPSLSIPIDRPGQHGLRDRIHRRTRLVKSIQLNPLQLRDIFLYIFKHEDISGVHWEEDFVFQYVPQIFETATVSKPIAVFALEESILYNCFHLIPE